MAVAWGGTSHARTADVSASGCFIDTLAPVAVGETLQLSFTSPDGELIAVEAEVVYELPSFGFGVRFTRISEPDRIRLEAFVMAARSE